MTININELRASIKDIGVMAVSTQEVSELLDRLELAESRQATYRKAFEISENTTRALTEKVIPNIREQLEAVEKECDKLKALNSALCTNSNAQVIHNARLAEENYALRAKIERIPSRITPEQAPEFIQDYCYEAAEGYADGWNACIKTITEKSK